MQNTESNCFEYYYRGNFTDDISLNVIKFSEQRFIRDLSTRKLHKRISFVIVESLQNITRHQKKHAILSEETSSIFVLQKTKRSVIISIGNTICNSEIDELERKIDTLTALSHKELSAIYKKQLTKGEMTERGGAGLGLISIAKRTDNNISYLFEKINDEYSYFYMQSVILYDPDNENEINRKLFSVDKIAKFHKLLNKGNILLKFNGRLAQYNFKNAIPLLTEQVVSNTKKEQKVEKFTLELLQNILYFADNKYNTENIKSKNNLGIVILSEVNNSLQLTAGNFILNTKIKTLSDKIDRTNKMSNNDLTAKSKQLRLYSSFDKQKKPDLSLIELKLESENVLNYKFYKVSESYSLFALQITI